MKNEDDINQKVDFDWLRVKNRVFSIFFIIDTFAISQFFIKIMKNSHVKIDRQIDRDQAWSITFFFNQSENIYVTTILSD